MTFAPVQNLFTQPDSPADTTLYVGRNPPPGKFGFVQWHGNPAGSMLTTDSVPLPGSDPNFVSEEAEWKFPGIAPFAQAGAVLGFSMEIEVPFVRRTGNAVPYAEMYFFFADPASNLGFWYGCTVYDIRGTRILAQGVQAPEDGTGVPIVTGLAGFDGLFSTDLGGEGFQSVPWFGFKTFILGISATNLTEAVAEIKASDPKYAALSDDPAAFEVTLANLNVEIARRNGSARLGYTVKQMSVDLYQASY